MTNFLRNKRIYTSPQFDLQSDGGGVSLVTTDDKVKSLLAGTNTFIVDNGDGTVTISSTGGGGGASIIVVNNYSALPNPTTVGGLFYWVSNSQGTSWLPGSLGGSYYNSGLYYSNGATWEFLKTPYQATQSEVNAGLNTDKFVTPETLASWTGVDTKIKEVTVATIRTTAAKIGTTTSGSYVPVYGHRINVTFTLGCLVNSPTINIDGSGVKNIQLAGTAVSTTTLSTPASSTMIPMYYNGTAWQIYGSTLNTDTNTTYIESTTGTAVVGATQVAAINNLYYADNATNVAFTLPAVCAINSVVEIVGLNPTGKFTIIAPSGDNIIINGSNTGSAGVLTGSVNSTVKLRCSVANTTWIVTNYTGVITTNTSYSTEPDLDFLQVNVFRSMYNY